MFTYLLLLRKWTLILTFMFITVPLSASWPSDVLKNLKINDIFDEQIQPLVAASPDGGCYISWFDRSTGSYRLFLQKLDARGNFLWGKDGLLVSEQKQDTWLTSYDMIADSKGNVIITFADIRNNDIQNVYAYKISPDKQFLWGEDGVWLSESEYFEHSPRVVETSDGGFMFAWEIIYDSESSGVMVQKLTSGGEKVFLNGNLTITSSNPKNCYSRIVASDNGSAIVAFMGYDSDTLVKEDDMILTVQKINASGDIMFPVGNPIKFGIEIQNCGGIVYFIRPVMISDGNNGAYLAWYDDRYKNNIYTTYIQHIDAHGNVLFKENGTPASTLEGNEMLHPLLAYNPQSNEPMIFWSNDNKASPIEGASIRCQRYNLTGKPVFGNAGKTVFAMYTDKDAPEYTIAPSNDGVYVLLLDDESLSPQCPYPYKLKCMYINYNGEQIWNESIITMTEGSPKMELQAITDANSSCNAVWCDQRLDAGGIYAQRINQDGTPGYKPTDVDDNIIKSLKMDNTPNPFSDATKISYYLPKEGHVSIKLYDAVGNEIKILVNDNMGAGEHYYILRNPGLSAGVYYCRMSTGKVTFSKMMVLIK